MNDATLAAALTKGKAAQASWAGRGNPDKEGLGTWFLVITHKPSGNRRFRVFLPAPINNRSSSLRMVALHLKAEALPKSVIVIPLPDASQA